MKKIIYLLIFSVLMVSCEQRSKVDKAIEEIPMEVSLVRFDKIFYETPIAEFHKMRQEHAVFFPSNIPDSVFINTIQNPLYRELYSEVQKEYANFTPVQNEIEDLFRRIKYYFPKQQTPKKITTIISEMDYENKVVYTDSILVVSLDLYLGQDHKFYEFPNYSRQTFQRSQILPDIVTDFSTKVNPAQVDKTFIGQMIHFGKELYLKDLLLPNCKDNDKIGYRPEQQLWCEENEAEIWRYFIEGDLLYDTDSQLTQRFILPGPFSKFYLEIDNESPGRVGIWIGWQIVRSYMKNKDVSIDTMLKTDAKTIFEQSRYKPKK